ncbi:MAG: NAD(P)-binding protein, partial [Oscillospiraceae bacterium]
KCISCLRCVDTFNASPITQKPLECSVNPILAKEGDYSMEFDTDGENRCVAIVGGGPAGLEAARILAMRNFKPIIFESSDELGGQLCYAKKPPKKERINWLIEYYNNVLSRLGVEIRLNTKATLENIKERVDYKVTLDKVISTNSDDYDENGRRILPEKEAILSDKGNERFHYRPTFVITPDMVNTITFLKSINAFAKLSDIAEPLKAYVKPIKGTYIEYPYYYKYTLGTEFFVSANNNNDNNINNSYFTADKSIIDNLSKSAVLRHVIDVEDYILILEYDNKSSSHFYIKAKDVPEDIKKAIEISAAKNKKPDSGSIYIS